MRVGILGADIDEIVTLVAERPEGVAGLPRCAVPRMICACADAGRFRRGRAAHAIYLHMGLARGARGQLLSTAPELALEWRGVDEIRPSHRLRDINSAIESIHWAYSRPIFVPFLFTLN